MSVHLAGSWPVAAAIVVHAIVHAAHLVDGALTRREFRRSRRARLAAAQVAITQTAQRKETAQ